VAIFKKSVINLGAAVISFSIILVVSVMVFMNSLYYEINMASLENITETLMEAIGTEHIAEIFSTHEGDYNLDQVSIQLNRYDTYRLTLIAPSGYVIWDSHVSTALVNHIDREEVIAALEGREGSSRRESISTSMKRIYHALPVFDDNYNAIGVFRLSISIPGFLTRLSPVLFPFLIFICLFLVTAFLAIIMYSRSLSTSLGRLVSIAQSSTKLLSDPKIIEHITPEFKSIENALRIMKKELNTRFEQAKSEGKRYEAILNGMSEAVFAMDCDLKLHLVNPKAGELFNLTKRNLITAGSGLTLLEATRSTELVEIAKKALSSKSPIETELTFHLGVLPSINPRATGSLGEISGVEHFQVYASPLSPVPNPAPENLGAGDGVVLVLQEITRLVKLERIRRDFVANVSHELRTPIQLIKGFSETLLDNRNENDTEKVNHFINIIHKNAGIMENLTNDLLILSSLENNTINTRDMEEENIASLINEAVFSLESQAEKKQIEIIVKCQENLKVRLYGSLILQALINLIDNGIKHSSAKSKLWVSAYLSDSGESDRQESLENMLIFEVRDKGIGIPAEHLEKIFERFYRVDRISGSKSAELGDQRGTGLGLSIVRHITLLHKGNAEVESHAGEGSIFRIKIPC
jgi:two-component system phosphate regulon sensor histidine kinase PhoR